MEVLGKQSIMDPTPPPPAGFLRKHWLGEYSLPQSFWLHTILLAWLLPICALTLLSSNPWHIPPRVASLAFVAIFLIFYPVLWWAILGTARASKSYRQKGGRKIWLSAAMWVPALLFTDSLFFFLNTHAIISEHFRMAFTGQYAPPASISVDKTATRLLLTGELREGSAAALTLALTNSPAATTIALDSKGGLLQEATLLANTISQHALDTYVERECSSACTFVFLAGRHRCIAAGARIGFHAPTTVRDLSRQTPQSVADLQRDLYLKAGLPEPFINTIMQTSNFRVWYPSPRELLEAHVTTPDCR
jgi:hypothetical protein